jgi:hypothetical protein
MLTYFLTITCLWNIKIHLRNVDVRHIIVLKYEGVCVCVCVYKFLEFCVIFLSNRQFMTL